MLKMGMNGTLKKIIETNLITILLAVIGGIVWFISILFSEQSQINTLQFKQQALEVTISSVTSSITTLIPQVAALQQLSKDTNDKVNFLYDKQK